MKTLIYSLTFLLLISCGKKTSNQTIKKIDSLKVTNNKIELKKYLAEGIFLKGVVRIFDNNQKKIGTLYIDKISPIQILSKSDKMFNIENSSDICQKSYFIKVKHKDSEYIVFGQDVYEINKKQRFTTINDKNENLTLFPITNFEMGASDDDGLTGCDDYSLLVLLNESTNHYSFIKYPENDEMYIGDARKEQAVLFHDNMRLEKIYKVTMKQDTLVIGIKAMYQEGGSVFNIKAKLKGDFPKSYITDKILYETDEELKKMDKIK